METVFWRIESSNKLWEESIKSIEFTDAPVPFYFSVSKVGPILMCILQCPLEKRWSKDYEIWQVWYGHSWYCMVYFVSVMNFRRAMCGKLGKFVRFRWRKIFVDLRFSFFPPCTGRAAKNRIFCERFVWIVELIKISRRYWNKVCLLLSAKWETGSSGGVIESILVSLPSSSVSYKQRKCMKNCSNFWEKLLHFYR